MRDHHGLSTSPASARWSGSLRWSNGRSSRVLPWKVLMRSWMPMNCSGSSEKEGDTQ